MNFCDAYKNFETFKWSCYREVLFKNLGNQLLIIIPALCEKNGSPFSNVDVCMDCGISYASLSVAISGIYIWPITYNFVRSMSIQIDEEEMECPPIFHKINKLHM